ncbi:MAG: hypothetical protein IJF90_01370, partial [Synergistaceae bacterium]|nr:hypothetical protein [Synergistaceae bacterium]
MKKVFAVLLFVALVSSSAFAAEGETVKLPDPEKSGGIPVIEAIAQRQSAGDFVDTELTLQEMSNLLWAAG